MSTNPLTIIQTADIPPIPHLLQRILSMTNNPDTTSTELEKLVSQEPALVTKLLKWVNSAQYALPAKVSSISHSMILLGFSTVRSIASGLMLMNSFEMLDSENKTFVNQVWEHTLIAANFSKILTHREPITKQDDIFLAAMIHDVGYIVLSEYFGKRYQLLYKKKAFPSPDDEDLLLGVNHVVIGTTLLKHWRFPDNVIEMVRCHHNLDDYAGPKREAAFLILSDELSKQDDIAAFLGGAREAAGEKFLAALDAAGWTWEKLAATKAAFVDSLGMTRKLFNEPNKA